jgi:hypothetical protein
MDPIKIEDNKEAIFAHDCCADGMKFLLEFKKTHPDVKVKIYGMFQTRDAGLHLKYGFTTEDLKRNSFIIYEGKLIKGVN